MNTPDITGTNRDYSGRFRKGTSGNPLGRPRNIRSNATEAKLAFLEAFEKLGGVKGLVEWAKSRSNRREFYKMLIQILPKNVDLEFEQEDWLYEEYKDWSPEDLHKKAVELARAILKREEKRVSIENAIAKTSSVSQDRAKECFKGKSKE